jgi:hypothetical protein
MAKYCAKCGRKIDEEKGKHCLSMTKKNGKIIQFDAFHFDCWKEFLEENLRLLAEKQ